MTRRALVIAMFPLLLISCKREIQQLREGARKIAALREEAAALSQKVGSRFSGEDVNASITLGDKRVITITFTNPPLPETDEARTARANEVLTLLQNDVWDELVVVFVRKAGGAGASMTRTLGSSRFTRP